MVRLLSLVRCRNLRSCSASGVPRLLKNSVDTAPAEPLDGSATAKQELPINQLAFPWISATVPRKTLFEEAIRSTITRMLLNYWVFHGLRSKRSEPYLKNEFLEGALEAFRMATGAIFQSKALVGGSSKADISEEAEEKKKWSKHLQNALEGDLAEFYMEAIAAYESTPNLVHYNLEKIKSPQIINYEVIFGAKRGNSHKGLVKGYSMALFGAMSIEKQLELWTKPKDEFSKSEGFQNLLKNSKFATVRLLVALPCTEVFFVKDTSTGAIIQGQESAQEVVHEVLFEISASGKEVRECAANRVFTFPEWSIVDIDGWLAGNKFWESG